MITEEDVHFDYYTTITASVTRLGEISHFGKILKDFG